jgi:hypothetical protein
MNPDTDWCTALMVSALRGFLAAMIGVPLILLVVVQLLP